MYSREITDPVLIETIENAHLIIIKAYHKEDATYQELLDNNYYSQTMLLYQFDPIYIVNPLFTEENEDQTILKQEDRVRHIDLKELLKIKNLPVLTIKYGQQTMHYNSKKMKGTLYFDKEEIGSFISDNLKSLVAYFVVNNINLFFPEKTAEIVNQKLNVIDSLKYNKPILVDYFDGFMDDTVTKVFFDSRYRDMMFLYKGTCLFELIKDYLEEENIPYLKLKLEKSIESITSELHQLYVVHNNSEKLVASEEFMDSLMFDAIDKSYKETIQKG